VCWLCSRFTENRSSWSLWQTPPRGGSVTLSMGSTDHLRKMMSNMVISILWDVCCTQSCNPLCGLEIIWGFKMSKLLNFIACSLACLLTCTSWALSCIYERLAKNVSRIIVAHFEMISTLFIHACLAWDRSPYACGYFAQIAASLNFISSSLLHVCYLLMVYLWELTLNFAKSWHIVEHSCFKYLLV
jgi:hypothetical protein